MSVATDLNAIAYGIAATVDPWQWLGIPNPGEVAPTPEPESDGFDNQHATLAQVESARRKSSVSDAVESLGWVENAERGMFELPGKSQDILFSSIPGHTASEFVDMMIRHGLVEVVA